MLTSVFQTTGEWFSGHFTSSDANVIISLPLDNNAQSIKVGWTSWLACTRLLMLTCFHENPWCLNSKFFHPLRLWQRRFQYDSAWTCVAAIAISRSRGNISVNRALALSGSWSGAPLRASAKSTSIYAKISHSNWWHRRHCTLPATFAAMTRMHFIARVSTPRLPPPPLLAVACLSDQHDRSVETLTSVKTMRLRRFSHINCRNIMHLADTSSLWNVNLLFASKTIIFLNLQLL